MKDLERIFAIMLMAASVAFVLGLLTATFYHSLFMKGFLFVQAITAVFFPLYLFWHFDKRIDINILALVLAIMVQSHGFGFHIVGDWDVYSMFWKSRFHGVSAAVLYFGVGNLIFKEVRDEDG